MFSGEAFSFRAAFISLGFALFSASADTVDFEADVLPALTRARCNSGPCHGATHGKNGFRLSLQGYLPGRDYDALTRDHLARRIDPGNPEASLLLLKAANVVPHEGGKRIEPGDPTHAALLSWIAAGSPRHGPTQPTAPMTDVLAEPSAVVRTPGDSFDIRVFAHFQSGPPRDVSHRVLFSSANESVALVDDRGKVSLREPGETVILCRYRHRVATVRIVAMRPNPDFTWNGPPANSDVDRAVFELLRERQINPVDLADDSTFLRRLWLDVAGRLPPVEETTRFLNDSSADKREQAIDQVLGQAEFPYFWALKFADVFRATSAKSGARGLHLFHRFLVDAIDQNLPLDQLARRILLARGDADRVPEVNFYRIAADAGDCAEAAAQLWLGVRIQCAKCHNHPFDQWTQDDYFALTAFFAPIRPKTNLPSVFVIDPTGKALHPQTGLPVAPRLLMATGRTGGQESGNEWINADPRGALADWLLDPANPYFAAVMANRIWFHLLGKGVVDPPDDFRVSNPPSNERLLNALARELVNAKFDLKRLVRRIVSSRIYQLADAAVASDDVAARLLAHSHARPLPAEVLLDAIGDVTEVPEKFNGFPAGIRAIQLPEAIPDHPILREFGQPTRETACECGRGVDTTLAQAMQLINSPDVQRRLEEPNNRIGRLLKAGLSDEAILEQLSLAAWCRPSTAAERTRALEHLRSAPNRRKGFEDVLWSILNTKEFVLRR